MVRFDSLPYYFFFSKFYFGKVSGAPRTNKSIQFISHQVLKGTGHLIISQKVECNIRGTSDY